MMHELAAILLEMLGRLVSVRSLAHAFLAVISRFLDASYPPFCANKKKVQEHSCCRFKAETIAGTTREN